MADKNDEKTVVTPEAAEAKAEKGAKAGQAPKAADAHKGADAALPTPAWVCIAVAALVVGVLCGHFLLGGGSSISLSGKITLTGDQLDSTIATYTYNGKTVDVTARQVISQSKSVDSAANSEGTYDVPVADDVVSYARNAIVLQAAKDQGISVTDDDLSAYANQMFQTDDYATIASKYGIDEDTAKQTISDSCMMSKLRDSVVTATLTEPAEGQQDTPTADYASYIIGLAGDEWDSANNTWASTDGDYYNALSSYEISNDSATYAAAQAAYYVAYSNYSTAYSDYSSQWTTYVNSLLSNASIQLGSLAV